MSVILYTDVFLLLDFIALLAIILLKVTVYTKMYSSGLCAKIVLFKLTWETFKNHAISSEYNLSLKNGGL